MRRTRPGGKKATARDPAKTGSLGGRAVHGAFWTVLLSILNKVITFAGRFALSWLLLPADFGLVALATSISTMMGMVSVGDFGDILVQEKKEKKFKKDFGQIFWLSIFINLILVGLALLAVPWIARAYRQPQLSPILMLILLGSLITGSSVVYSSALMRSLKFKTMAVISLTASAVQSLTAIGMAWLGLGPYSIVVPAALMALVAAVFQIRAVGHMPLGRPKPKLWVSYLAPAFWLLFLPGLVCLQNQATSLVMGFTQNTVQVGLYFWGFSLSYQIVFLICGNLSQIFIPTFSHLNEEPRRQGEALKKSAHALTAVLAYFCVLQAVIARPLIGLIIPARLAAAAPVVSMISLGMLTQPLSTLYFALFMALRRYRLLAASAAIQCALVVGGAMIGSLPQGSDPQSAAACTSLGFFLAGLYCGWKMFRHFGDAWRSLFKTLSLPLLQALVCGLLGAWAVQTAASRGLGLGWQAASGFSSVSLAFALGVRLFDMETFLDLRTRAASAIGPQTLR